MNNISINKHHAIPRLILPNNFKIQETKKQTALEEIAKMDSLSFFKEFNSILCSKDRTPANNNTSQENIATLLTNRGYDKGVTASASLAIIYHLIRISKSLGENNFRLYDNNSSQIDSQTLKCYLNLFMNLSDNDTQQILEYAKGITTSNETQTQNLKLHNYSLIYNPEQSNSFNNLDDLAILLTNSNNTALMNANKKEVQIYKSITEQFKQIIKKTSTKAEFDSKKLNSHDFDKIFANYHLNNSSKLDFNKKCQFGISNF